MDSIPLSFFRETHAAGHPKDFYPESLLGLTLTDSSHSSKKTTLCNEKENTAPWIGFIIINPIYRGC